MRDSWRGRIIAEAPAGVERSARQDLSLLLPTPIASCLLSPLT